MFYTKENLDAKKNYINSLKTIGTLSNLFSDSNIPYLYYRIAEKIFCNSFGAKDLSRGDVALDACKNNIGIGLKTFLASNNKSFQKIAEFNKDRFLYENLTSKQIIKVVSNLRNNRIEFTQNLYSIDNSFYHCIIRDEAEFKIYEEKMDLIDIDNISNVIKKNNIIKFHDEKHEYSFNLSKSTLTKRFITKNILDSFEIKILTNPLDDLLECLQDNNNYVSSTKIIDTVFLPLYGKNKIVYPKSGLNQWNANGRLRDENEVYIPIPIDIHRKKPDFFPNRETPFDLKLPNSKLLKVKVCQSSSKALMSYSNKTLGKWILRDVLKLEYGELLTYKKLQFIGIDSVRIDKVDNLLYEINFSSIGSYETFIEN